MSNGWSAVWTEVKRAARQAPRMYAAPWVGAVRQTRLVLRQIARENRSSRSAIGAAKNDVQQE
jgi:hypothetical protein